MPLAAARPLALPLLLLASCGGERAGSNAPGAAPTPPQAPALVGASQVPAGAPGTRSGKEVADDPLARAELRVESMEWGRLVDVYELDPTGAPRLFLADYVIGEDIASDGVDYELAALIGLQHERLTILHGAGTPAFAAAFERLDRNLVPVIDKGLDPAELPPFSMVPRDAALLVGFSEPLDTSTVGPDTVRLQTGVPPATDFDARVLVDRGRGRLVDRNGDGQPELYPTHVVLDLAVDALDARRATTALPINEVGLPAAIDPDVANAVLRLPTRVDAQSGQTRVLASWRGATLAFDANGSTDPASPTRDLVRAFRSGGAARDTGDLSNGFLTDSTPPRVVADQAVDLQGLASAPGDPVRWSIASASFALPGCALAPAPGDVLVQDGVWAEVLSAGGLAGASATGLEVLVHAAGGEMPQPGPARLLAAFAGAGPPGACFLRFAPLPSAPPDAGVGTDATVTVAFSEALDPASVRPLESLSLARTAPAAPLQSVVAQELPAADLASWTLVPALPLAHAAAGAERYFVDVSQLADLAGNPLAAPLLDATFTLDPAQPRSPTGGLALRFGAEDELYGDGLLVLRGQLSPDYAQGIVRGRPVSRFAAAADRDEPVPSVMPPVSGGVQAPLTPLGCKLQKLWRYVDFGFSGTDEAEYDLDVEGLSWAPVAGQVVADQYAEFSIALGHSRWLPDEAVDIATLFPQYPLSGLTETYADNFLRRDHPAGDVVHDRSKGYVVSPADAFTAESGRTMVPYPLNRGIPAEQRRYFTWRDTTLALVAGRLTSGVPLEQEVRVLNLGVAAGSVWQQGEVPTAGLPLLMELRCYPDGFAHGLNAFESSIAAPSSWRPNFRAFSAGGIDSMGNIVLKDPDAETVATGGYSASSNPPGQPTLPADNLAYLGQVDFVVRRTVAHSVWLDTGDAAPDFEPPLVAADLPAGTDMVVEWRGATAIAGASGFSTIVSDAASLGPYGDRRLDLPTAGEPVFLGGDPSWKATLDELDGARYVQLRITFVGDAADGDVPALDAMGLVWRE